MNEFQEKLQELESKLREIGARLCPATLADLLDSHKEPSNNNWI